jgi:uncharacterized protein YvpB
MNNLVKSFKETVSSPVLKSSASTLLSSAAVTRSASQISVSQSAFLKAFMQTAVRAGSALVTQTKAVTSNSSKVTASQKKDVKIEVPHLIQGNNECGPTSLAMVMKYYGIDPGNYHDMFPSDTFGHSPLALSKKAQEKGMVVRQGNNGSLEDLAALVDKGIPVMVSGIWGGKKQGETFSVSNFIDNCSRAHWMVVTGYKRDDSGKITNVYFNEPNTPSTMCWTASDFMTKFWNDNIVPGGQRQYMAMAKTGSFQENLLKGYMPKDKISDSFKLTLDTIYTIETAYYKTEVGVKQVAKDIKKTAVIVADEVEHAAKDVAAAVESAADTIADTAKDVANAVADVAEDAGSAIADAADDVADWLGGLFG